MNKDVAGLLGSEQACNWKPIFLKYMTNTEKLEYCSNPARQDWHNAATGQQLQDTSMTQAFYKSYLGRPVTEVLMACFYKGIYVQINQTVNYDQVCPLILSACLS